MPDASDPSPAPQPRRARALGGTAAQGFAFAVVQTLSIKLVSFGGQILLTRVLLEKWQIEMAVLAIGVSEFANVLQRAGLREILIRRYAHFQRWSTAAFWMALSLGLLAAAAMVAAGPVVAWLWNSPGLVGLILTVAIAAPFASVSTVASAKLEAEFRFRAATLLGVGEVLFTTARAVSLAWAGAGAYSLVIPVPLAAILRCLVLWTLTRPPVQMRLHLRRWRFLYVEGGLIFGGYVAWTVISQGDYIILKSFAPAEGVVASYWQAYVLSTQTIAIFSMSMLNVLLPVLSHMGEEPQRQVSAFLRAVRVLAVLTMPLCVLQAVLAEPGVRFVFGEKWLSSIPLLQVLSLGMAVRVAAIPAHSMLKAQGRARTYFLWLLAYAGLFAVLVSATTFRWGAMGTAIGVAITVAIAEGAVIFLCIRPAGLGWGPVLGVFARPLVSSTLAGAAAAGAVAGVFYLMPPGRSLRDLVAVLAGLAVAAVVYAPLARLLSPTEAGEIRQLGQRLLRRRRQADSAPSAPTAAPTTPHP